MRIRHVVPFADDNLEPVWMRENVSAFGCEETHSNLEHYYYIARAVVNRITLRWGA